MTPPNGKGLTWPRSIIISYLVVLAPALFLLPILLSTTSGADLVVELGGSTTERLEDRDGDGLAEFLVLDVDVEVFEPGSYGLHGSTLDGAVTANAGPLDLPMGGNTVELRFSGSGLSRYHPGGRIEFDLEVFPRDPSASPADGTYITLYEYSPQRFEAPSAGTGVEVTIIGQEVLIVSKVLRLAINTSFPQITFSYAGEVNGHQKSTLSYVEVVAYDDTNGNDAYDRGTDQKKYDAPLDLVDWNLRTDFSQGYEISLHGVVPLRLSDSATAVAWAKITFNYRSRSLLMEGVAQKFDIDIELWQPLDADHIAVLHELRDLSGERTIVEGEGGSIQTDDRSVLRLTSEDGLTTGIYSWSDDIEIGVETPHAQGRAQTSFAIEGPTAYIIFAYPLSNGTLSIHHDPVIGMDPEGMPEVSSQPKFLTNRPLAMLIGSVIGMVIVAGTVIYRSISERRRSLSFEDRGRKGGD